MFTYLEENNIGTKSKLSFKRLIFARQRYWGEPVPIVHMNDGTEYVLKDEELPLILPVMEDYKGKMVSHL